MNLSPTEYAKVYCAGCGIPRAENPGHAPGSTECKQERRKRRRLSRRMRECYTSYGDPKLRLDEQGAADAVRDAAARGITLRAYTCRWCNHLHVGRAPTRAVR